MAAGHPASCATRSFTFTLSPNRGRPSMTTLISTSTDLIVPDVYVETVTERLCGTVLASTIRPATVHEVQRANARYASGGQCDHTLIKDEAGWMYDYRSCAVCGKGLGAI